MREYSRDYFDAFWKGKNDGLSLASPPQEFSADSEFDISQKSAEEDFALRECRKGYRNGYISGLKDFILSNKVEIKKDCCICLEEALQTNEGASGFIHGLKRESPLKRVQTAKQKTFCFHDISLNFQYCYIIGFMASCAKDKIEIQEDKVPLTQQDYDKFLEMVRK